MKFLKLPLVLEGQIIPIGLSKASNTGRLIVRIPLLLTWRKFSVWHLIESWGTLNLIYSPKYGVKIFWAEHLDQPRIL
jgi:hypothetical protein